MSESGFQVFRARSAELVDTDWWSDAVDHVDDIMAQDGGHDWGHIWRVLKAAHDIAKHEPPCDLEVVSAAVLFHDVVNLPKDSPDRHLASTRSADVAVDYFGEIFGETRLGLLHEAIRCHSYSAGLPPEALEAKIVSDADKFEALGAFGIARTFYVSGLMKRTIVHPFDPFAKDRPLDDAEYAVDQFFKKLLKLESRFHTGRGQEIARERIVVLESFLEQLASEM